jgi:hypothetical protein
MHILSNDTHIAVIVSKRVLNLVFNWMKNLPVRGKIAHYNAINTYRTLINKYLTLIILITLCMITSCHVKRLTKHIQTRRTKLVQQIHFLKFNTQLYDTQTFTTHIVESLVFSGMRSIFLLFSSLSVATCPNLFRVLFLTLALGPSSSLIHKSSLTEYFSTPSAWIRSCLVGLCLQTRDPLRPKRPRNCTLETSVLALKNFCMAEYT